MLSEKLRAHRIISIGVYLPIVTAIVGIVLDLTGVTRKFIEYSGIWFGDIEEFELHVFIGSIGAGACIAIAGGLLLAISRWKPRKSPYLGRIVVALVLIPVVQVVFVWLSVVLPYQRERQIAARVEVLGGKVQVEYRGPVWISQSLQGRLPFFDRITDIQVHDGDAALSDLLSELGTLHKLESLELSGTQITDVGLEHLKGLTNLKRLFLYRTQVTDAGLDRLKGLTSLEVLYLIDTLISDSGLEHLKGMTNLKQLMLGDTQVTDTGLEHLKGLTSLVFLDLDNTEVTDAGIEHLKNTTALHRLRLGKTQVTDAGLEHLKELPGLSWLELSSTEVTDGGLSHLSALTSLGILDLAGTQVTDFGLEHFKGLKSLTRLYLSNTTTTAEGREKLRKALPSCQVEPNP